MDDLSFLNDFKFVEVSLGHKYRVIHKDGTVSGGAIRYLSKGLGEKVSPD